MEYMCKNNITKVMMMSKFVSVLYIDEVKSDLDRYANALEEEGKIKIIPRLPSSKLDETVLSPPIDLVLIDYLLTTRQSSDISVSYRGGTAATYISEQLPEIPLLLLSTRGILNEYPNYENEVQAIDCVIYKDEVNTNPEKIKSLLICLSYGFQTLRTVPREERSWEVLISLLGADDFEEEELQKSSPPKRLSDETWSVKSVARWVLRTLLKYPGIFYDSLHAASALGIHESSFLSEEVQHFFKDDLFSGLFSGISKIWWKDRVQKTAFQIIQEAELKPRLSENFMTAFHKKTGIQLEPSICVYSGEKHANVICYLLQQPVKMKYTLGYLPDDRPESMEQARISYKAVIEEDFKKELIPKADAERIPQIRGG